MSEDEDQDESDRWEYETLRPPRGETMKESEDPKAQVNELAADGWRLIDTIDYTGGGTKYIVFERPARSDGGDGGGDDGTDDASDGDDTDTGDSDADDGGDDDDTGAGDDADGTDADGGGSA